MTLLALENLSVQRGRRTAVNGVSLKVGEGEFVGLIGPNGAGKTSLMRGALGLLPAKGRSSLSALDPRARARAAAWMPQSREIAWPVSVRVLVALGRMPHLPANGRLAPEDAAAVDRALATMGLEDYPERIATRLSGGEQARVLIARALAQETPLLMADEPIAGLDPANQIATMRVFAGIASEGRAVIASIHDLGLAVRHCSRLVMLGEGRLVADGRPEQVLTPDNLAEIFGVRAHFAQTSDGPVFQPLEVVE